MILGKYMKSMDFTNRINKMSKLFSKKTEF